MNHFVAEFGAANYLSFPVVAARLLLAALLGGAVGFEREWQQRPAGLRTHILVCLAGALIAILTIEIAHAPFFQDDAVRIDPIRLIEAVTAGVAFLAAGVIILSRGEVHGLTTGAGMWLAAGVGLACGLGYWLIALFATALALIVLHVLQQVQSVIPGEGDDREGKDGEGKVVDDAKKRSAGARKATQ